MPSSRILQYIWISIHPPRVGRDAIAAKYGWDYDISIHPPRVGRDRPLSAYQDGSIADFNPPSPCGEGRVFLSDLILYLYFNPPSPCGEGRPVWGCHCNGCKFQSTLPVWGGTHCSLWLHDDYYISIHPPRVGRDTSYLDDYNATIISIHPPRVGRDRNPGTVKAGWQISIHPPRVGRDLLFRPKSYVWLRFQSTLPVWGGTEKAEAQQGKQTISIHPPRVGRDLGAWDVEHHIEISIHPPRVGRDWPGGRGCYQHQNISIHPPRVGRDDHSQLTSLASGISIHPPRVGRDYTSCYNFNFHCHFNPPSPCGEGQNRAARLVAELIFQSTLPVWGGTLKF